MRGASRRRGALGVPRGVYSQRPKKRPKPVQIAQIDFVAAREGYHHAKEFVSIALDIA